MPQLLGVSHASQTRAKRAPVPESIGAWQLLQLIGQGQWTNVYRGQPKGDGGRDAADYAIKVLKPQFQDDPLAIEMLRREALVTSKVRHVHLTSVLSHHTNAPPYYLVSPYLVGVSLRAALRQSRQLAAPHAFWIARQTAEALVTLHSHGWRHADIKPENILVGPNGHTTLLDLGLAERIQDADCGDAIKGSPAYWSPESCCDELLCGPASDIYSLGVTLYESLTGRCPFERESPAAMATAHRDDTPADPRLLAPQLGARALRLLRAMLAKRPEDRPTARQLIDRLVDLEIDTLQERIPA